MFFDFMLHPVAFVALEATGLAAIAADCDGGCQRTRGFPAEHLVASAESLFGRADILCPTTE